jgi:DNA-binding transcriptional ArsR family regulator
VRVKYYRDILFGTMSRARPVRFSPDPDVSSIGALIGDPARAAMLFALLDGRTLPATELARRAGVSPTAASGHLAKLVAGRLLVVEPAGRQRFYRIAASDVGRAMEALAVVAKPPKIVALTRAAFQNKCASARSCYDHLAGKLGVGLTDAFLARHVIVPAGSDDYRLTVDGKAYLLTLGIDVEPLLLRKRHFARQCLDWTERRPHLAGALGFAVRGHLLAQDWIACTRGSRAICITTDGYAAIEQHFNLNLRK